MDTHFGSRLPVWLRTLRITFFASAVLLLLALWSMAPDLLQTSQHVALSAPLSISISHTSNQTSRASMSAVSANSGVWQVDVPTNTPTPSPTPTPGNWDLGDVFVGADGGSYRVYDGNGSYKHTIYQGINSRTNGCAFDRDVLNLYTTDFNAAKVVGFEGSPPHSVITPIIDPNAHGALGTESVAFDANGDLYVGNSTFLGGNGYMQRYRNGIYQQSYTNMGAATDWIDLSSDQRTMYFASEDRTIRRYDIVSGVALTPFAILPIDGGNAREIILLPGDVGGGLLVADKVNIKRLNAQSTPIATYDAPGQDNWEPIALRDGQGTSFWAGDLSTGGFYRFNLASGQVEYNTTVLPRAAGICVKGSYSAARPTNTPTNTPTDTPTNTPTNTPTHAVTCALTPYWCTAISPNINPGSNELRGLAAVTNGDIWAVGNHTTQGATDSLVQHWDGGAWAIVTVTPVGGLRAIAKVQTVVPTPELWAMGDSGALHYANGNWITDSHITGMNGVVALTANDVWAVGNKIQHFDGQTWGSSTSANGTLNAVAAVSQNDVWAVGFTGGAPAHTLIKHWNGSSWQTVPGATIPTDSFLKSVDSFNSPTNPNNVWAVGSYADANGSGHYHTLTEHWDGSSWTLIPSPDGSPNSIYNVLNSVWYNSEGDLWAAGSYDASLTSGPQTLILRWTDDHWQQADSPNLGVNSELLGVGTTNGRPHLVPSLPDGRGNPAFTNSVWAVGHYQDSSGGNYGSLIERIIAPTPTAYATPQSVSYYEHDIDPDTHHHQGCLAASNHDSGIAILDYGQPIIIATAVPGATPIYGTLLIPIGRKSPIPVDMSNIVNAAEHFVDGYYDALHAPSPITCPYASGTPPNLILALAINNYSTPTVGVPPAELTSGHAQEWANAVNTVTAYAAHRPTPLPNLNVAAAMDFEPQWSMYSSSSGNDARTWAKGYSLTGASHLYNFGSTDGYPAPVAGDPTPIVPLPWCCSPWRTDQLFELNWLFSKVHPIPEIYETQAARDWYQVKSWGFYHGYFLNQEPIAGVTTQCGDGGCHSPNFNWTQAWQVLWLELNADRAPLIQQPTLDYSTDIHN